MQKKINLYFRKVFCAMLSLSLVLDSIPVLAVTETDGGGFPVTDGVKYWDQGRAYSALLKSGYEYQDTGKSTVIISIGANYNFNGDGRGRERIRLFSKIDRMNELFPPSSGYTSWTEKMNLRFYNVATQSSELMISSTDPVENVSGTPTQLSVIWDIVGYLGGQTNSLQALSNKLATSGTKVISETGRGFDSTVIFYKPDDNTASLSDYTHWYNCDYDNQHNYRGVTAVFEYTLPKTLKNFEVWPQGMVTYACIFPRAYTPMYMPSGAIGIKHLINKT